MCLRCKGNTRSASEVISRISFFKTEQWAWGFAAFTLTHSEKKWLKTPIHATGSAVPDLNACSLAMHFWTGSYGGEAWVEEELTLGDVSVQLWQPKQKHTASLQQYNSCQK